MAIQGFLDGRDVFIVLPTDFGKTACFTCLPHAFDLYHGRSLENKSIVIVVSPPNSTVPTSKTTGRHCKVMTLLLEQFLSAASNSGQKNKTRLLNVPDPSAPSTPIS